MCAISQPVNMIGVIGSGASASRVVETLASHGVDAVILTPETIHCGPFDEPPTMALRAIRDSSYPAPDQGARDFPRKRDTGIVRNPCLPRRWKKGGHHGRA